MKKKFVFSAMLALVLALGFTFLGCSSGGGGGGGSGVGPVTGTEDKSIRISNIDSYASGACIYVGVINAAQNGELAGNFMEITGSSMTIPLLTGQGGAAWKGIGSYYVYIEIYPDDNTKGTALALLISSNTISFTDAAPSPQVNFKTGFQDWDGEPIDGGDGGGTGTQEKSITIIDIPGPADGQEVIVLILTLDGKTAVAGSDAILKFPTTAIPLYAPPDYSTARWKGIGQYLVTMVDDDEDIWLYTNTITFNDTTSTNPGISFDDFEFVDDSDD